MYANRSSSGNAYRVHMHSKISDCVWHINDTRLWLYVSEKSWIPLSKCNVHQLRSAEQIRGQIGMISSHIRLRGEMLRNRISWMMAMGKNNMSFHFKSGLFDYFFSTNVDGRVNDMLGRRKIRDKFYGTHITLRLYKQAYSWRHSLSRTQWVLPKFMGEKNFENSLDAWMWKNGSRKRQMLPLNGNQLAGIVRWHTIEHFTSSFI